MTAELDKLSKEIEAHRAGLKILKVGSSDHLAKLKQILEKQGAYEAQEEYQLQQKKVKYQRWIEALYVDILRETSAVAKKRSLDLVIAKDEVEFPALSVDSAMLAIRTHKLLYSDGCLDITDEVMAQLDAEENAKK